jgi:phospholipase C
VPAGTPDVPNAGRRTFLTGLAAVAAATSGLSGRAPSERSARNPNDDVTNADLDRALRDRVKTVVVIFAENRSFDNLFGDFPGVERPLSALKSEEYLQLDCDGKTPLESADCHVIDGSAFGNSFSYSKVSKQMIKPAILQHQDDDVIEQEGRSSCHPARDRHLPFSDS